MTPGKQKHENTRLTHRNLALDIYRSIQWQAGEGGRPRITPDAYACTGTVGGVWLPRPLGLDTVRAEDEAPMLRELVLAIGIPLLVLRPKP